MKQKVVHRGFFTHLVGGEQDPILALNALFRDDPRSEKVNLGVGAYKTEEIKPYLLPSVQEAEKRVYQQGLFKEYLPISGDDEFLQCLQELLLGQELKEQYQTRISAFQSVGGTAAVRIGAELLKCAGFTDVFLTGPSWPNHKAIFHNSGMNVHFLPYYSEEKKCLDFDAYLNAIQTLPANSVLLFHACCHNPTGFDPTREQWKQLAEQCEKQNLFPFFDCAYQGFGEGLAEDAYAVRFFLERGFPLFVALSCSKNFGLYGERVGALLTIVDDVSHAEKILSSGKAIIRSIYSNPPLHGVRLVKTVLQDPFLRKQWEEELTQMRNRIQSMRSQLLAVLEVTCPDRDFSSMKEQKGMFSYTGLKKEEVQILASKFGIYMPPDGRINVAGLAPSNLEYVAKAIASLGS